MTTEDRDLEHRLRQFRPVAPSLELRRRVLARTRPARAFWLQVAAAVALLAIGFAFNQLTVRVDRQIDAAIVDARQMVQP
jgi:hypothetical protein